MLELVTRRGDKADLLRSLSWIRVTPTFLEGGKEQRGPVWLTGG